MSDELTIERIISEIKEETGSIIVLSQHCPVRNLLVPAFVIPECFYRVSRGSSSLDSR